MIVTQPPILSRIQAAVDLFLRGSLEKLHPGNVSDAPTFVGIHVRRANYKDHLRITEGARLVNLDFFKRAILKMEQKLSRSVSQVTILVLFDAV